MAAKRDLKVHRRVGIAMSVLPPVQREAVGRVIHSLRSFTENAADSARVKKIEAPGQQLYMMRITPKLWLVYTETSDVIEVLDLVERATLDFFSAKKARNNKGRTKSGESPSLGKAKAGKLGELVEK